MTPKHSCPTGLIGEVTDGEKDVGKQSESAIHSRLLASICHGGTGNSFLEFAALPLRQVRLLIYSSERANTRATHLQGCPRQPRKRSADQPRFPANRVRSATASGDVARLHATPTAACQISPAMKSMK